MNREKMKKNFEGKATKKFAYKINKWEAQAE